MILGNNRVPVMQRESGQIQAVDAPADSALPPADALESHQAEGKTERESPVIYQSEGL
jgi:hypothetical protein